MKCKCSLFLCLNAQCELLFHLLSEHSHKTVYCTVSFSEPMLFPGRGAHKMTMSFFIALGICLEVPLCSHHYGQPFTPSCVAKRRSHRCWLSAMERGCVMRHWWGEMRQWCQKGGICISCWNKQINAKSSSSIISCFLDFFHRLVCDSALEAPGVCLYFSHHWIMFSFAHYPLPEFPQSVSRHRYRCFVRNTGGKAYFYSQGSQKFFWEVESLLSYLNNTQTIKKQTTTWAEIGTQCVGNTIFR